MGCQLVKSDSLSLPSASDLRQPLRGGMYMHICVCIISGFSGNSPKRSFCTHSLGSLHRRQIKVQDKRMKDNICCSYIEISDDLADSSGCGHT